MKLRTVILWLVVLTTQAQTVATLRAAPTSTQAYYEIGGRIEPANSALEIPDRAQRILFDIGDPLEASPPHGSRVRYQLQGIDPDWLQKRDEMSFTVLFYDEVGDQVGQQIYLANGKSSGWNGSVEQSTFTQRHETLVVPPGAVHLCIVISSAGPPTSVGIYVVAGVRVVQNGEPPSPGEMMLDSEPFLRGNGGPATPWIRTGRHPSLASLIPSPGAAFPGKAFCILDDDPTSYAEWTSPSTNGPRLTPGRRVTIDWNEIYDTGVARWERVAYEKPPPGRYHFVVQEVDLLDGPLPTKHSLEIVILPPYWRDPWFWGECAAAAAVVIFLGVRCWQHSRSRLRREQFRLMEQERLRIARDLHDDLGARLTHISLMSAFAAGNAPASGLGAKLHEISAMARNLVTSLSEVVWTVNPENDRLEPMVHYLCQLIQRLCQPAALKCRVDESTGSAEYAVSSQLRHHVVLAVKEAVNNALRHSEATELHARIRFHAPTLTISIADNGRGLPAGPLPQGNGIRNMRERIALINGQMKIESSPGEGTSVLFDIPIC